VEHPLYDAAVVIASQRAVVRRGLAEIVAEIDCVHDVITVGCPAETAHLTPAGQPALNIVDVSGWTATVAAQICGVVVTSTPDAGVLVLAPPDHTLVVQSCLAAGAISWVSPSSEELVIRAAVEATLRGQQFIDPRNAHALTRFAGLSGAVHAPPLTPRERDVLGLLTEGCSNRAISNRLTIAEPTVKGHVSRIMTKLNVNSRLAAALKGAALL
jgi:DNA-binding NarL/FixJ family response regulator